MYKGASLCLVVPAYNEAAFIRDVIEGIPDIVDTLVVVDDCSTDGTWETVKQSTNGHVKVTKDEFNRVHTLSDGGTVSQGPDIESGHTAPNNNYSLMEVDRLGVRHTTNRGRGGAVKTGYRLGLMGDHDVIAVMDGDGQMNPEILPRIVDPVVTGDADYAVGNRLTSLEHCHEMPRWRLFGNLVLTGLTRIASGHWQIYDSQNGYTAISAETLSELSVSDLYDNYGFLNDMLIRLGARGKRVTDVPMAAVYGNEESGISYQTFIPALCLLLLRRFLWRLWFEYVGADKW